ncbi:hypothetical protein L3Q82_007422 [Scortum barcoo]|uniref:Uncharacterized protein n=1 Tax=Scortum barcoo TaxID=214431 RepID=A0ACB8WSY9_9TELE|nr:hypothetical protein L3Q82_007422 [Scortum barcoo]
MFSHDSKAYFTKAPSADFASTPLQPFSQSEDDLRNVPWPESSPSLLPQHYEEAFPLPPPPVSCLPSVSAADQASFLQRPPQQHPQPPFVSKPNYVAGAPSATFHTPEYTEPYTLPHRSQWRSYSQSRSPPRQETLYRGPKPHIPYFTEDDLRQFARLKIALDNILPADATERFKFQILVNHLKLEDALLIADSYSSSSQAQPLLRLAKDTGASLNEHPLPGPTLGSTLLGVLLRFREYPFAVSSDIKGMFHQVRLLPEDKPFLRFLWRDMDLSSLPECLRMAGVDNLLQSFTSESEAKHLVNKLQQLLLSGGFELRQWATNAPEIIKHMPPESISASSELWLSMDGAEPLERTLGLLWHCMLDTITYRLRHTEHPAPTMRIIGLLIPYTTRAKILVQRFWSKKRDWDDPQLPSDLLQLWHAWKSELNQLPAISLSRCYIHPKTDISNCIQSIHIFSDVSEKAYSSVAYLRTVDQSGEIQVAFLAARSRVESPQSVNNPSRGWNSALPTLVPNWLPF